MATPTEGAYPIDATTPVGLFRFQVGDVNGTPHDPADDLADYEFMSDATIEALIAANPDSLSAAKAQALLSMATQLIASAQDIQVDDIRIKTVERANLMRLLASDFLTGAESADAASAFDIVGLQSGQFGYWPPQGTPWPDRYLDVG